MGLTFCPHKAELSNSPSTGTLPTSLLYAMWTFQWPEYDLFGVFGENMAYIHLLVLFFKRLSHTLFHYLLTTSL